MTLLLSLMCRRMMSTNPTSRFVTLLDRPMVKPNGEIGQGSLKLHYWEWQGRQPTILFCHAASFHGRCYDPIINGALNGFHVIALDFRCHGRSQTHSPPYLFRWFAEDVLHFIEALELWKNNLIGIGHSIGGYTLTFAAAQATKQLFRSLLLLDPVVFSPSVYNDADGILFDTSYIRRRKHQWSSVNDMILRLEKRGTFSKWPKETLHNYCTYALDENNKLVCAPDGEASIYESGPHKDSNIYPIIEKSKFIHEIPVRIVRASAEDASAGLDLSPTCPDLYKCFKKGHDTQLDNVRHLFPMEQPELVVDIVKQMINHDRYLFSHL